MAIGGIAFQTSNMISQQVLSKVLGATWDVMSSKEVTWCRRALPLVLRFAFNLPVAGSVFGVINIYIGLGASIVRCNRAVKGAAKYWGYLYAMQHCAGQMSRDNNVERMHFAAQPIASKIYNSASFRNHQKGGIEVNSASFANEFRQGVIDAVNAYNKLFAGIESAAARELMQMVDAGASQSDRKKAYLEVASELRFVGAMGLYKEATAGLPSRHIKDMLGY